MSSLRKSFFVILAFLVLGSLLLAGCGTSRTASENASSASSKTEQAGQSTEKANENKEAQHTPGERVIKHEMGDTKISGTPERIVALEFSYVDALAALGISPVGVADDNDPKRLIEPVRAKIKTYTSVGTRKQPSLEVISSLKPDLIIADLGRHKDIYDQLQQIAPTIVLNSLSADYQGIIDGFKRIGEAVGKQELAEQILNEHKKKMEALKAKVPAGEKRIVMPAVVTNEGFHAHSALAYTGSLLESIGLKNAIQKDAKLEQVNQYNKINLEQVEQFNPDILFLIKEGDADTVISEWKKNPLWQEINAVKHNQVYEVDRAVWAWSRGLISTETIVEDAINQLYGSK